MTTADKCKLVAEFMAVKRPSQLPEGSLQFNHLPLNYLTPESFKRGYYGNWNKNWNLLVPVIAKINKMDTTVSPLHLTEMNYHMQRNEIEKAFDAVVNWIRRYNNQWDS